MPLQNPQLVSRIFLSHSLSLSLYVFFSFFPSRVIRRMRWLRQLNWPDDSCVHTTTRFSHFRQNFLGHVRIIKHSLSRSLFYQIVKSFASSDWTCSTWWQRFFNYVVWLFFHFCWFILLSEFASVRVHRRLHWKTHSVEFLFGWI